VAKVICEKHGLTPEFVLYDSVPGLLKAVESGECHIGFAGITITPEREKRVDFSKPFFDSGLTIAVRNEALDQISYIGNTTSEDFLRYHNVKIVLAHSFDELLANLKNGRSDAIVYDAPPLMYAAKLDPDIKVVGDMFAHQSYGIVFPNHGGEALKEMFDIEIMLSRQNGEYQKIYSKWF
jgi:ABC-type amino acid transport substrate-binding protein